MRLSCGFLFCVLLLIDLGGPVAADELTFIANEHLKLGIKESSGGGIAWVSAADSQRNLVNHFDRGRLIQQSYYGVRDDSLWNDKPWRWNPVQGGDWRGSGAKLLELKVEDCKLYAKTLPKHWASGKELDETRMEQWITLEGQVAHVRYRFTYTGETKHPMSNQEIPAVFLAPDLATLVLYDGDHPWTKDKLSRSKPGWPNESRRMTESWAAYVDQDDFGLGVYVPVANKLTCYRFGDGNPQHGACSYFAPLTDFAIEPGLKWEYDLYITIGQIDDIRARFNKLHEQREQD
jgi:hypothetical protein